MKAFLLIFAVAHLFAATCFSSTNYAYVLEQYVNDDGWVDYAGLKKDRSKLDEYIEEIAKVSQTDFDAWTKKEQIAFLINGYNARTLQVIIDHYPVEGIRKIDGAWNKLTFLVLDKARTLDDVEHRILRKKYDEPRIHMALVCAARSCPKLRNEPYTGKQLESQLTDQTRDFLSKPTNFKIDEKRVYISKLFDWFKKDFKSVSAFIKKYSGKEVSELKIKYQPYDWSLNKQD